jgi:hypothetical protein
MKMVLSIIVRNTHINNSIVIPDYEHYEIDKRSTVIGLVSVKTKAFDHISLVSVKTKAFHHISLVSVKTQAFHYSRSS